MRPGWARLFPHEVPAGGVGSRGRRRGARGPRGPGPRRRLREPEVVPDFFQWRVRLISLICYVRLLGFYALNGPQRVLGHVGRHLQGLFMDCLIKF